jgi:hypothetical protein
MAALTPLQVTLVEVRTKPGRDCRLRNRADQPLMSLSSTQSQMPSPVSRRSRVRVPSLLSFSQTPTADSARQRFGLTVILTGLLVVTAPALSTARAVST